MASDLALLHLFLSNHTPFRQEKYHLAAFILNGSQREIHDRGFFAALSCEHLNVIADMLALGSAVDCLAQLFLHHRRNRPPERLPEWLPYYVVACKPAALQGCAIAFQQNAICSQNADELAHLIQSDSGQLLQILLRSIVWVNLSPAHVDRVVDFGGKELHALIPMSRALPHASNTRFKH
jgi:hypothetical protein